MSRFCPVAFKKDVAGNRVSHANNKSRRLFMINLRPTTLYSMHLNRSVHLRLSTKGIKTIEKYGGLDGFIKSMPSRRLCPLFKKLRKEIEKKSAQQ
jgi:large subunit ribosomal protein L28